VFSGGLQYASVARATQENIILKIAADRVFMQGR